LSDKFCSGYIGTDKNFCESIKPRKNDYFYPGEYDYSSKCIYGKEGCQKVSKECSDASDYFECSKIELANIKKKCVFLNNTCVEQYKTCQLYEDTEESITQKTCESIMMDDINTKCVFF